VFERDGCAPIAILVTSQDTDQLNVELLRVDRGPLASTMARQMVRQCNLLALATRSTFIEIQDESIQEEIEPALAHFGFFQVGDGWLRIGPQAVESVAELSNRLRGYNHPEIEAEGLAEWADLLREQTDAASVSENEHLLWPAKISDATIPTFLVPIKPHWAQELFDDALAKQVLYARKEQLALNVEGVYYRSARPALIVAPARILWYVSAAEDVDGAKQVRACSRLLEVRIGQPKELFKQFRRLGIYEWKDVYRAAGSDVTKNAMAIHFDDTELFANPVPVKRLKALAAAEHCPLAAITLQDFKQPVPQALSRGGPIRARKVKEPAALLSIRPRHATNIFNGTKTVELRRTRPRLTGGSLAFVYVSGASKRLIGSFRVAEVIESSPLALWRSLRQQTAISRAEFDSYFEGTQNAFGIQIASVHLLPSPVHLTCLRNNWPGFHPPQTYRYFTFAEIEQLLHGRSKKAA